MPGACDMGHGRGRTRRDGRSACDLAGMGERRARLRYRLRALPCRGGAGRLLPERCSISSALPYDYTDRPAGNIFRHKGVAPPLAIDVARLKPSSSHGYRISTPRSRCASSRAGSRTRPISCRRRTVAMCSGASRRGNCCPSAHAVDREFRVISALSRAGISGCRAGALLRGRTASSARRSISWDSWKAALSGSRTCPQADPRERAAVYDAMNATLARIALLRSRSARLADFGRGENYVARQIERWSKQYQRVANRKIARWRRLPHGCRAHLPPPAPVRLVHGDYRLDNIILAPSEAAPSSPSSTGSFRPWATRSPISPTI